MQLNLVSTPLVSLSFQQAAQPLLHDRPAAMWMTPTTKATPRYSFIAADRDISKPHTMQVKGYSLGVFVRTRLDSLPNRGQSGWFVRAEDPEATAVLLVEGYFILVRAVPVFIAIPRIFIQSEENISRPISHQCWEIIRLYSQLPRSSPRSLKISERNQNTVAIPHRRV